MGVFHISGLGRSPGAVTVPLTSIYLLHVAQTLGNIDASNFFVYSGEAMRKDSGSREMHPGKPETLITFTSKELLDGNIEIKYSSKWFNLNYYGKEKITRPIRKYFEDLFEYLMSTFEYKAAPLDIYFVEVDHRSFNDAFEKAGLTMKGLQDKEVWVNMIGGSNQLNIGLLAAGTYTAIPSRYYYLFQSEIDLLEPEEISKPKDERGLEKVVREIIDKWMELPMFNLGLGELLRDIYELFSIRESVGIKEVIKVLEEKHSLNRQFLAKLRRFLIFEDDRVRKRPDLDRFVHMWREIDRIQVSNFAEWKKKLEDMNILQTIHVP